MGSSGSADGAPSCGTEGPVLSLGNVFEFNWRFLGLDDRRITRRLAEFPNFHVSAEASVSWGPRHETRIVVTPRPVNVALLSLWEGAMGIRVTNVAPRVRTGWVCRDLVRDDEAVERIVDACGGSRTRVLAWGLTRDYARALSRLRQAGAVLEPEAEPSAGAVRSVMESDSKVGARSLLTMVTAGKDEVLVPPGAVCPSVEFGLRLFFSHCKEQGARMFLKADYGWGGRGVMVLPTPGTGENVSEYTARIRRKLTPELWARNRVVLELFVGPLERPITPSVDGYIDSKTGATVLWAEEMVTRDRMCVGVRSGRGVIGAAIEERILSVARAAARRLSGMGYRGWFDIDYLLGEDGQKLYVTEMNVRRTGGTAPIELCRRLFGESWAKEACFVSEEKWPLSANLKGTDLILGEFDRINASYRKDNVVTLPLNLGGAELASPYVGFVVCGREPLAVSTVDNELRRRLSG